MGQGAGAGRTAAIVMVACALTVAGCGGGGDEEKLTTLVDPPDPPAAKCRPMPAKGSRVAIRPRWTKGDTRKLTITRSRRSPTSPEREGTGSSTATLRVTGAGRVRTSLVFETSTLSLRGAGTNDLSRMPEPAQQALLKSARDLDVEYRTDSVGNYASLSNPGEISEELEKVAKSLIDALPDDEPLADRIAQGMKLVTQNPAFIDATVAEIPRLLHVTYGLEFLRQGERQRGESTLSNPYGGKPIPATATVRLVDRRDRDGCVVVTVVLRPKPKDLRRVVDEATSAFGAGKVGGSASGVSLVDRLRARYDPGTGWIVSATATKSIRDGSQTQIDKTRVESR